MSSTGGKLETGAPMIWLALILVTLQLPFLGRGVSFYDEGSILAIAEGLSHGDALYRDRVTNMGPLVYEMMGLLMRLFGPDILLGRVLQGFVFIGCGLAIYQILRDLGSARAAWLGTFAWFAASAAGKIGSSLSRRCTGSLLYSFTPRLTNQEAVRRDPVRTPFGRDPGRKRRRLPLSL